MRFWDWHGVCYVYPMARYQQLFVATPDAIPTLIDAPITVDEMIGLAHVRVVTADWHDYLTDNTNCPIGSVVEWAGLLWQRID